jgi:tRNA modification GTPase
MALSALAADVVQMEDLQRHIVDLVAQNLSEADASTMVMNQRHRQHLYKALEVVQSAAAMLRSGHVSGDRLALDLRIALHELGAITGEITTEDILGEIFSRFCIGK